MAGGYVALTGVTTANASIPFKTVAENSARRTPARQRYLVCALRRSLGDCGGFHGWVIGVPVSNPVKSQIKRRDGELEAGSGATGGPASDGTHIFVTTGNGPNNSTSFGEQESILRFGAGPTFVNSAADRLTPRTGKTWITATWMLEGPAQSSSTLLVRRQS